MSDHLPIVIKAYVAANVGLTETQTLSKWKGYFANNQFYFSSNKIENNLVVEVYDLLGKLVKTERVTSATKFQIQLNNLQSSLYFVKIITTKQQESFKVLVR